jgi:hypothetical protein
VFRVAYDQKACTVKLITSLAVTLENLSVQEVALWLDCAPTTPLVISLPEHIQ